MLHNLYVIFWLCFYLSVLFTLPSPPKNLGSPFLATKVLLFICFLLCTSVTNDYPSYWDFEYGVFFTFKSFLNRFNNIINFVFVNNTTNKYRIFGIVPYQCYCRLWVFLYYKTFPVLWRHTFVL